MKTVKKNSWIAYIGWSTFANLLLHGLTGKIKTGRDFARVLAGGAIAGAGLCGLKKIVEKMSDGDERKKLLPHDENTIDVDPQYELVYKGTQKWGNMQKAESRRLTPSQLAEIDGLNFWEKQRVENLYYSGQSNCEDIYESTPVTGVRNVLSNRDGLADEVITNFYMGKKKKLTFDENHHLSTDLNINPTFKAYWRTYLKAVGNFIVHNEDKNLEEYFKANNDMPSPNFSVLSEIKEFDYYGLMGGTQQIEVELEIYRMNTVNYLVNTKMFIRDTYCADKDDIKGIANKKILTQSLPAFYVLQNCFGCHPFVTEIIYKHSDIINIAKL